MLAACLAPAQTLLSFHPREVSVPRGFVFPQFKHNHKLFLIKEGIGGTSRMFNLVHFRSAEAGGQPPENHQPYFSNSEEINE